MVDRPNEEYRPGMQHPQPWREDLNPQPYAGQNRGVQTPMREGPTRTAYDMKELHRELDGFDNEELKRIPVLPEGTRLQQGATYLDLTGDRREFTAMGDMEAEPGRVYVPKDRVDYPLWNRLIGVRNPERLDQADER